MSRLWPFLLFILLFTQLRVCKSSPISQLFECWCKEYGKTYASAREKQHRLEVFEENYDYIVQHNRGNSSYVLALNSFADLSSDEFRALHSGLSPSARDPVIKLNSRIQDFNRVEESDIPLSVDWREKGAVTEVKDQGDCDASWAFSVTGAVEGLNKIVTGELISLSEQELIDCDVFYNKGCKRGLINNAYHFIIEHKGINTEDDYPYQNGDNWCNEYKENRSVVTIDGYAIITAKDEKKLQQAVATQPVSVGIRISPTPFQFYRHGIFSGPCSTSMNHAVLIVGYGSEDGSDYWIIKNSWGKGWGIGGYMHLLRNTGSAEGICGINMLASYPIKTSPNPPPSPPAAEPNRCSLFTWCYHGEDCCCTYEFLWICWSWVCCSTECAEFGEDHRHCSQHDYSIGDTTRNKSLKLPRNSTLEKPSSKRSFSAI